MGNLFILCLYLLPCWFAGYLGKKRKIGFWIPFIISFLVSFAVILSMGYADKRNESTETIFYFSFIIGPFVAIGITLFSKKLEDQQYEDRILENLEEIADNKKYTKEKISIADELEKLNTLKNSGAITDEEFNQLKLKLLEN
jgi:hypothetical protein